MLLDFTTGFYTLNDTPDLLTNVLMKRRLWRAPIVCIVWLHRRFGELPMFFLHVAVQSNYSSPGIWILGDLRSCAPLAGHATLAARSLTIIQIKTTPILPKPTGHILSTVNLGGKNSIQCQH